MNQESPEQGASGEKKASPFEGMSREELIRKCKFLLSLVQKTKQSKEELVEENKNLKEDINNYESQKSSDKKCLKAMQEVVDSLTENKLNATMRIGELEGVVKSLEGKMREFAVDTEGLSVENEALKRQINRLTDENDALAADVTSMDVKLKEVSKIGVEQQNLLLHLREATSSRETDGRILEETREELSKVTEENTKLLEDVKEQNRKVLERQEDEEKHQKEMEKSTAKMKLYRGKIVEMSLKLKQLKQSYKTVVEVVKEYSVTIPEWQKEMQKVAGKMQKFSKERDEEMEKFTERIKELENQKQEDQSKEVQVFKERIQELESKSKDLEEKLTQKQEEFTKEEEFRESLSGAKKRIIELEESLKETEIQRENQRREVENLQQNILNITQEFNEKTEECEKLTESVESESKIIIENQKREVESFQEEILKLSEHSKALESQLSEKQDQSDTTREEHEKAVEVLQQKIKELTEKYEEEQKLTKSELENQKKQLEELEAQLKNQEIEFSEQSNTSEKNHIKKVQDLEEILRQYSEKSQELEKKLKQKENDSLKLKETLESQSQTLNEDLTTHNELLQLKIQEITQQSNSFEEKLTKKESEIEELSKSFEEKLRTILEKHQKEASTLQQEIERLEAKSSELEIKIQEKEQELQTFASSKAETDEANLQITNLKYKLEEMESRYRLENGDLLKEMTEINEVLKERGETISKQQLDFEALKATNEKLRLQLNEAEQRIEELQKRSLSQDPNTSSSQIHLEDSTESIENFEEKYNKLRVLAQKLKKKVSDQNAQITLLETEVKERECLQKENEKLRSTVEKLDSSSDAGEVKTLKKEKEAFLITQRQLQKEIEDLRKNLAENKNQVKEAVQREQNMKSELEKSKAVAKKSNVLSLEIDAYEKSLNEVSQKLDAKKHQVQDLEASIESQRDSIKVLKDQIRVLEESLKSEQNHSAELKKQVDAQQKKLRESDHDKTELRMKLDQASKEINNGRQDMEEIRGQLSEKGRENEKVGSLLQAERDKYVRQVFSLEEEVTRLRNEISDKSKELEETLSEFSSYKVRAQSVLMKRHETKDTSRERELEEEVAALQSTVDSVNGRHGALKQQHDELERMVKVFQDDKIRSQTRLKELMTQLEETRLTNESLIEANKKQLQDHQEALKIQRLHIETLNACFKTQIDDLHEKYSKEMAIRVQSEAPEATNIPDVRKEERSRFPFDLATTDEQKMDLMLMEREDGEGSENTSQSSNVATRKTSRNRRDLIPLDELLNSPFEDHEGATGGSISPNAELQVSKEKLLASENYIKHLTALLAEAEQDLAKLTQLNEVLKEEVRRQQRSLEREAHMHNSEYLKNVVFKFLTLNSGDEKAHLVPVLNTILKLSPDETQKLQSVAKGEGLGWGSLLPIWSNHQ